MSNLPTVLTSQQQLMISKLPEAFRSMLTTPGALQGFSNDDLRQGISAGFPVFSYRGKVWRVKFKGEETPLMREDGDGARSSIDVVIVKAKGSVSKIFYKSGYIEGSDAPPDCFSVDGVVPDASVVAKPSPNCAQCPFNQWGSRMTEAGKKGKACADSRRLAVLPADNFDKYDGPLLLRVPAASLNELAAYATQLNSFGYQYFMVKTRISFDVAEAYPKLIFQPASPLTEQEAQQLMGYMPGGDKHDVVERILSTQEQPPAPADGAAPAGLFIDGAAPAAAQWAGFAQPGAAAQPATPEPQVMQAQPVQPVEQAASIPGLPPGVTPEMLAAFAAQQQQAQQAAAQAAAQQEADRKAAAEAAKAAAAKAAQEKAAQEKAFLEAAAAQQQPDPTPTVAVPGLPPGVTMEMLAAFAAAQAAQTGVAAAPAAEAKPKRTRKAAAPAPVPQGEPEGQPMQMAPVEQTVQQAAPVQQVGPEPEVSMPAGLDNLLDNLLG